MRAFPEGLHKEATPPNPPRKEVEIVAALLQNHRRAANRVTEGAAAKGLGGLAITHGLQVADADHFAQRSPADEFGDFGVIGRKAQNVPHLHQAAPFAHGGVERHALLPRGPDGFFQQHVEALRQGRLRGREMEPVGQGHDGALGLSRREGFGPIGKHARWGQAR